MASRSTRRKCRYIVLVLGLVIVVLLSFARLHRDNLTDLSLAKNFVSMYRCISRLDSSQGQFTNLQVTDVLKEAAVDASQNHNSTVRSTKDVQHTSNRSSNGTKTGTHKVLLTMVVSSPGNKALRDSVRETWKNSYAKPGKQFDVRFVIGTLNVSDKDEEALLAENEKYNDLVFLTDHLERYENLTRKVLHMFMWADRNVNYSYLLKADDDSFARLDVIESELIARTNRKALYWGRIGTGQRPFKKGKWKEDKWTLGPTYLPFAFGGGYVLSADLVHRIAVNADGIILYNNEDVSVGAWVSPFDLERKDDARFDLWEQTSGDKGCKNSQIVIHYQTVADKKRKHERLISRGTLCP